MPLQAATTWTQEVAPSTVQRTAHHSALVGAGNQGTVLDGAGNQDTAGNSDNIHATPGQEGTHRQEGTQDMPVGAVVFVGMPAADQVPALARNAQEAAREEELHAVQEELHAAQEELLAVQVHHVAQLDNTHTLDAGLEAAPVQVPVQLVLRTPAVAHPPAMVGSLPDPFQCHFGDP